MVDLLKKKEFTLLNSALLDLLDSFSVHNTVKVSNGW
jgi:hypothetical protein